MSIGRVILHDTYIATLRSLQHCSVTQNVFANECAVHRYVEAVKIDLSIYPSSPLAGGGLLRQRIEIVKPHSFTIGFCFIFLG